ncbi:MAG: S-methyl-5-thioribose-1-phosphate isomerase [Gammaproteobacteria bacterium]|nr:S-methyl-5-thioribose-1-phosphate isomerase [Gammaproteobacteria bacterium]
MNSGRMDLQPISWRDGKLCLLDQRALPAEERYLDLGNAAEVADAIRSMVVRGAPAIGIAAAYGVVLSAQQHYQTDNEAWFASLKDDIAMLAKARPTAVNLSWALKRMRHVCEERHDDPVARLLQEARAIHEEDLEQNLRMAELGAQLLKEPGPVITHCNTGALATGGHGTALGVIRTAHRNQFINRVYATETRPWMQGARLTAWELSREGIPTSLVTDGAAAHILARESITWVIVGADRITACGDVANKIGTYALALAARHHGVGFMVVAPTSSVDMQVENGEDISLEHRDGGEIWRTAGVKYGIEGVDIVNPVFDITPAELVDAIVTERGVVIAPDRPKMVALFT